MNIGPLRQVAAISWRILQADINDRNNNSTGNDMAAILSKESTRRLKTMAFRRPRFYTRAFMAIPRALTRSISLQHAAASQSQDPGASHLPASTLLQSIAQAHAAEALQMMLYHPTSLNATSAWKDKIFVLRSAPSGLTRGAINHMGCRKCCYEYHIDDAVHKYGWRYSRLEPTAEEVRARRQYPGKPGGRDSGQCDALRSIPGLVGDSRMRDEIGHKKSGRER
ncbi:hypothetical protein TEQG_08757 [Trichophyton equinum CBS 127.97]|uniref:Uncharacterized protein n=1 Tax=Trichophyton equinum (strain ATCC MYA-4606 / CBS 127.97) TaxID=559882 RepID=F2Q042_TRIEC|nr:hypothetical protein TEQG_08757 [Trichophyton equinum CBS 127.97]